MLDQRIKSVVDVATVAGVLCVGLLFPGCDGRRAPISVSLDHVRAHPELFLDERFSIHKEDIVNATRPGHAPLPKVEITGYLHPIDAPAGVEAYRLYTNNRAEGPSILVLHQPTTSEAKNGLTLMPYEGPMSGEKVLQGSFAKISSPKYREQLKMEKDEPLVFWVEPNHVKASE